MKWSNMGICLWLFVGAWVPMANGQADRTGSWPDDVPEVVFDTPEKVDERPALSKELERDTPVKSDSAQKPNSKVKPTEPEPTVTKSVLEKPAEWKLTEVRLPVAKSAAVEPKQGQRSLATPPAVVIAEVKPTDSLPTDLQPAAVRPDLAEATAGVPVEVTSDLSSTTSEAESTAVTPIVVANTVVKSLVGIPIAEPEPSDTLDLVELASNAEVPAEVASGSEPEAFQTRSEVNPASVSPACCSSATSSCRGSCGNHSCHSSNYGRWRGMKWGRVCDDRCSPLWRGCFEVRRPGSDLYHHMNAQVMNGLAAQMILYRYDFLDEQGNEGVSLSRRGKAQLDKIVKRWETYGSPIVIEPTKHEQLDQQRRDEVLRQVSDWGIHVDPEMVVVGRPNPTGLAGPEAELIYGNMLKQTQSQGGSASGGGSSVGNASGSFGGSDQSGNRSSR